GTPPPQVWSGPVAVKADPASHTPPPGAVPTVAPLSADEAVARSTAPAGPAPAEAAGTPDAAPGTGGGEALLRPESDVHPPVDDVLAPLPAAIAAEVASAEPELHALLTAPPSLEAAAD